MNRDLIKEATSALVPLNVKLRSLNVEMNEDFDPDLQPEEEFETYFRFKAIRHAVFESEIPERTLIKIYAASGVRLAPEEDKDSSDYIVEIKADFVATYALLGKKIPCEEALNEFAKHNSPLHIWPYWRELLSNMGDRFGFGQIVLPMYRIKEPAKPSTKEKTAPAKKKKEAAK